MFILRRITEKGLQINTCLGDNYVLVVKEHNKEEFERTIKLWSSDDIDGVFALITYEDGSKILPLYVKSSYYVMASDGNTFDNITAR